MNLMNPFLNSGRLLVVDNFYTSVLLAKTNLPFRNGKNWWKKHSQNTIKRLCCGDVVAYENKNKVVFMAWRNKKLVQMMNTKFKLDMVPVRRRQETIYKPNCVVKYNETKQGIDL